MCAGFGSHALFPENVQFKCEEFLNTAHSDMGYDLIMWCVPCCACAVGVVVVSAQLLLMTGCDLPRVAKSLVDVFDSALPSVGAA